MTLQNGQNRPAMQSGATFRHLIGSEYAGHEKKGTFGGFVHGLRAGS